MPLPPEPFKYVCPKCNYSKIVNIKSDALSADDIINLSNKCPKCGTIMDKKELNTIDIFLQFLGK